MSRLTKKEKWINPFTNVEFNYKVNGDLGAIEKLGKIEDFEEILGCPLEVVFKAIKEGFIIQDDIVFLLGEKNEYTHYKVLSFIYNDVYEEYGFGYGTDGVSDRPLWWLSLKDYGKTWWLKGDMGNDEN